MSSTQSPAYPTLAWLVKTRRAIRAVQWIIWLLGASLGTWLAWRTGWPELLPLTIAAVAASLPIVRSYLELVDLISDMLLPK